MIALPNEEYVTVERFVRLFGVLVCNVFVFVSGCMIGLAEQCDWSYGVDDGDGRPVSIGTDMDCSWLLLESDKSGESFGLKMCWRLRRKVPSGETILYDLACGPVSEIVPGVQILSGCFLK